MSENIAWKESLIEALKEAKEIGKPVLLDFFNPN